MYNKMMRDDMELLREYARHNSQEAFAALVSRYINLVYSVALRQVRDTHMAQEVTQATFIVLARKSRSLGAKTVLSGWLCRTARHVSADALKIQLRRQHREQEAYMQSLMNESESSSEAWRQIEPLLDTALAGLGEKDHNAIVLRFFEGRNFRDVGRKLGATEDAAKMRVNRALEKLRTFFTKRGVMLSAAAMAGAMLANSVQAAPVGLATTVTAGAVVHGASVSSLVLTLVKGALKIMAWTKAKTAIVIGAGMLLAAGTTTITVKEVSNHREESVWNYITSSDFNQLKNAPPAVSIRPTKFKSQSGGWITGNGRILGLCQPFDRLLAAAYHFSACRILPLAPLPPGNYDYIATVPQRPNEFLQEVIKDQFGIAGRRETRETDVLLLTVKRSNPPGLKPTSSKAGSKNYSTQFGDGKLKCTNISFKDLAEVLESCLGEVPVVDQTGITNRFDFDISWDDSGKFHPSNPEGLKRVLMNQLGLELVPGRKPIEMLVVEKTK